MTVGVQYLGLGDYLVIAGAVLDEEPEVGTQRCDLNLAETALNAPRAGFGDVESYPDLAIKAAVLCWYLIRMRPLPDGNRAIGYLCMVEFIERNGRGWKVRDDADGDETAEIMAGVEEGSVAVETLATWVSDRMVAA